MTTPIRKIVRRMKSIKLSEQQRRYCLLKTSQMREFAKAQDWFSHGICHKDLGTYICSIVDGKGYESARYYLDDNCTRLEFKEKNELQPTS